MRRMISASATIAAMLAVSVVVAAELKSGLQPGQRIGAFNVVKVAGAADDGVSVGDELCYRCKYGARPMVMVFARTADESLGKLAKELDTAVSANSEKQFKAFVNVMSSDRDAAEKAAKDFCEANGLKNVPVVVPVEFQNGPGDYGINPEVDLTIIVAANSQVAASHAVAKGSLNEETIKAVLADIQKLVQ